MNDPTELDVLLHRVASRGAAPADWSALWRHSERSPEVWRRLAETLRDEDELAAAVGREVAVAECVALTGALAAAPRRRRSVLAAVRSSASWGGWFAAAALGTYAFTTGLPAQDGSREAARRLPDTASIAAPGDRPWQGASPAVVGTLPALMVGSRPTEDGRGYEVLYLNPTLERVRVDDLYRLGHDEFGDPAPLPVRSGPPPVQEDS